VCANVLPGETTPEQLDVPLALLRVDDVQRGDLKLAPGPNALGS
jgi:hypothetical protein